MATPEQLERALRNADAAGDTEAAKVLAGEITKLRSQTYMPKPDSAGERFARGMAEPLVGAGQLMARPLAVAGQAVNAVSPGSGDYLESLPAAADQQAAHLDTQAAAGAPEGMDWARLGGNAMALAPTALAGGVPATMGGIARAGAVMGGVGGATAPVADAERFGTTKAGQAAGGVVLGAVASPILAKAVSALGQAGGQMVSAIRQRFGAQPSAQQVQITIQQTLQQAGIDYSRLPQEFIDDVTIQVQRATAGGGSMDAQAVTNRAAFEQLGMRPTQGQVSRDPTQWGQEQFLRQTSGGAPLAQQYTEVVGGLNSKLGQMQGQVAPALDTPAAGARVMQPLEQAAERGQRLVGSLYDIATAMPGQTAKINGTQFGNAVLTEIERDVSAPLPGHIAAAVNKLSTGALDLDVNAAQRLIKAVNKTYRSADDATRYSLDILKRHLDDALQNIGNQSGKQTAQAYKVARLAAADRFKTLDSIPALKAVADGDIAPDDFVRKFVTAGKVQDVASLKAFLQQADPQAWNQLRGQVLAEIRGRATKGQDGKFLQDQFNTAIRSLQQSGKLNILFSPEEVSTLRAIGVVGRAVQEPPPGVSMTGMGGAAKATEMLSRLLGRLGTFAQAVVRPGVQNVQATAALRPAPVASAPVRNALADLAPYAGRGGPFVGLPLLDE